MDILSTLESPGLRAPQLGNQPNIIPSAFTPAVELKVEFPSQAVHGGNVVRAGQCKSAPSVTILPGSEERQDATYTLLLVDPDAPTPDEPKFGYWRHWIVTGLKASSDAGGTPASDRSLSGTALTQYLGPGPKDGSGPHRYLFLLFREPEGFKPRKEDVGGEEFVERRSLDAVGWVQKMGLELVGLNWMFGVGDGWKEA